MTIDKLTNQDIKPDNKKSTHDTGSNLISKTVTGEIFHPVRLYYKLNNKQAVHDKFMKMACIDFDESHSRWVWLYIKEAKKLTLGKPYRDIPTRFHPIVIGSFFSHGATEMYLDVRSIERAKQAVLFFDKHIDRSLAEVTHAAVVYQFEPQTINKPVFNFDHLFSNAVEASMENPFNEDMDSSKFDTETAEQRTQALAFIKKVMLRPYSNVEKIPLNYYADGIDHLNFVLKTSFMVAHERANGNENITRSDIMKKMISHSL